MYITDNEVLLRNHKVMPTICCAQRNAEKCVPTEEDFIKSNINGFGDDIGKITNRITSMFSVQSNYPKDSEEYKTLDYRIQAGQLLQQDSIDRIKGIVSNPMPLWWYERRGVMGRYEDDEDKLNFNMSIAAYRKPYFMKYIYSRLNKEVKEFRKNCEFRCRATLGINLYELLKMPEEQLNDEQREFVEQYNIASPTDDSPCTMNRICWYVEQEMNSYPASIRETSDFNFTDIIGKVDYPRAKFYKINKIYKEYISTIKLVKKRQGIADRVGKETTTLLSQYVDHVFMQQLQKISTNFEDMVSLMVDACYGTVSGRILMWALTGVHISKVMQDMYGTYRIIIRDDDGDIEYLGNKYRMVEMEVPHE